MTKRTLLAAALAMLLILSACAGDPDTSSVSPAPSESESSSTVTDAGDASAQPDESQPAGDEGAASTPDVEGEPEKEPEPTPEQAPEAEPEKEPEVEPAPEVTPTPDPVPEPEHTHAYTEKKVAATCTEAGYTLHKCTCGDEYKDSETAALGHKHTAKVTAPTCEKGGYTTYTCTCGDQYKGNETAAKGHSYDKKIIAPTTTEKGYTLYTCAACGDNYKGDYVDKLPEASQTTGSSTEFKPDGWKGDDYGSGEKIEGDETIAGQFVDHKNYTRKFYTPGMTATDARTALNSYVGYVYGYRFFADGISVNDADEGKFAKIVAGDNGKLGVNVFGWRKSYDSDVTQNASINMVMEAFYFMCGDKDVAYSLFNVVDYMSINGNTISNDKIESFGFTWSNETSSSIELSMNGVNILWTWYNGVGSDTFWFN